MDKNIAKQQILKYMKDNCHGVRNAKPHRIICEALVLEDRTFRELCEALKDGGYIASDSEHGYWYVPQVLGNDIIEIEAVKRSVNDYRSRATKFLNRAKIMSERLGQKLNHQERFA